jgi:glycosyltransferase involved in cell wall biosynthesis
LKYTNCSLSFYSNGIDSIFLDNKKEHPFLNKNKRTIIYAGNIGEGQGLDRIIPKIAKVMENEFSFIIYGDGGAKQKLINAISELNINNIEIHNPINRSLLIEEYSKADFLFLHLNNHKAFERVLPSKLFEYGAFNKPIIAGVAGYAADFINENLPNTILFDPCDYNDLYNKLINYNYVKVVRSDFEANFSRKKINEEMAKSIIYLVR